MHWHTKYLRSLVSEKCSNSAYFCLAVILRLYSTVDTA